MTECIAVQESGGIGDARGLVTLEKGAVNTSEKKATEPDRGALRTAAPGSSPELTGLQDLPEKERAIFAKLLKAVQEGPAGSFDVRINPGNNKHRGYDKGLRKEWDKLSKKSRGKLVRMLKLQAEKDLKLVGFEAVWGCHACHTLGCRHVCVNTLCFCIDFCKRA